jgi:hypothetical protein
MELITILNRCHRFRGFVYERAHFSADKKSIEVAVRPRKGSTAVCSRCHLPAPGYDQLAERRFEFIPLWGFLVFLLYTRRRVDCRRCGVVAVEEVPWGDGKRTLTKAYMLFLARWARKFPRSKATFQRCCGGLEQQGQSHDEKIVRLSRLPRPRTCPLSLTWQAARAGVHPRFLLMSHISGIDLPHPRAVQKSRI